MVVGALDGVRVLDFSWALAGPFATLQLADLGAEVVRVEHPAWTEQERGPGPYVEGFSSFYLSVNRGKRAVAIDLATADGQTLARELAAVADVIVESFRPGVMEGLGLGFDVLRKENPGLVYASVSGFGQTGPRREWAGLDAVAQAAGGTMALNGEADGPPLRMGVSVGDTTAGLYAALGILAALRHRDRTGEGQHLDLALADAQVAQAENAVVRTGLGEPVARAGGRHALMAPFGPFATRDGHMVVGGIQDWQLFAALVGQDDLAFDERFETNEARLANEEALEAELGRVFEARTTGEWLTILGGTGACAVGPVNEVADLFADEQVAAREMIVQSPLPGAAGGTVRTAGSPLKLSATPADDRRGAPAAAADTDAVLREWAGQDDGSIAQLRAAGVIR